MKLEIKHLAAYLPYGLKIQGQTHGEIAELSCLTETTVNIKVGGLDRDFTYGMWADIFEIKPILRPLSDFGGKRIGKDVKQELKCSLDIVYELWDFKRGSKTLEEISYGLFLVMCQNHIDFNKLIEKGLAIDINTIE